MICDFPDLYDYGYESRGVGRVCLMCCGGNGQEPGAGRRLPQARRQAGPDCVTPITPGTPRRVVAGKTTSTSTREARPSTSSSRTASRPAATHAAGRRAGDLAHRRDRQQQQRADDRRPHYECALEQADGRFNLDPSGANSGDSGTSTGPERADLQNTTTPNSRWWDGSNSGLDDHLDLGPGDNDDVHDRSRSSLVVANFGYVPGGWQVDRHPRFLADLTGDGRADIVGFGDAGVYVSRRRRTGRFGPPQLAVTTSATRPAGGGWSGIRGSWPTPPATAGRTSWVRRRRRVRLAAQAAAASSSRSWWWTTSATTPAGGGWRRHPRFLADTTGDGRADIVGFGDAGVYVSRAQADSTFAAPRLVVDNFGYVAGGWRVEQPPAVPGRHHR